MRIAAWCASAFTAVGTTTLLFAPSTTAIAVCSTDQESTYSALLETPPACDYVLRNFKTCADDCLDAYQNLAQHAPNCSRASASLHIQTYREQETARLERCERARANTTNKYIPQGIRGVRECSVHEMKFWDGTSLEFEHCNWAINANKCTDECLRTIENVITHAPMCLILGEYTLGESKKYVLAQCLTLRGEDLLNNTVLQTVVTAGSSTSAATAALSTALAVGSAIVTMLWTN